MVPSFSKRGASIRWESFTEFSLSFFYQDLLVYSKVINRTRTSLLIELHRSKVCDCGSWQPCLITSPLNICITFVCLLHLCLHHLWIFASPLFAYITFEYLHLLCLFTSPLFVYFTMVYITFGYLHHLCFFTSPLNIFITFVYITFVTLPCLRRQRPACRAPARRSSAWSDWRCPTPEAPTYSELQVWADCVASSQDELIRSNYQLCWEMRIALKCL